MEIISMYGLHEWEKVNLVTTRKGDLYRCKNCGVEGYRIGLSNDIKITKNYSKTKLQNCDIWDRNPYEGRRVIVKFCGANGKSFSNMTPGSIHKVIEAPEGEKPNGDRGVWVMGVGEPVKLLFEEFVFKPNLFRTKPRAKK